LSPAWIWGGGPPEPEQDGRLLEQRPGRRVEARLGQERQRGEGPEQERVADPRPPSIHGETIEGVEDAQLHVQGDQLIQRPRGHRGGHQRSHAAPQLIEHRLLILPEPLDLHDAPPWCA